MPPERRGLSRGHRLLCVALYGVIVVFFAGYLALLSLLGADAGVRLAAAPAQAEAALVLGSRAYVGGRPNPCLAGRVDAATALARSGRVRLVVVSGGVDREDGRVEAEVMARRARATGYAGALIAEPAAQSTRENLALSRPLLEAAGVRRVVIVSEPYHLWRVARLARASGFERAFDLQYVAAPTVCWHRLGMRHRGALREPLVIVHNALRGDIRMDFLE